MEPHGSQPLAHEGAPLGSAPVIVMVHGRGAGPKNIFDLIPRLGFGDAFTYLAPAAANNTWYPSSFLAETEKNEPGLTSALTRLAAIVDDVTAHGITSERIAFVGFSQGACLMSEFAARHARRYGAIVAFSGGLIGPPGTPRTYTGSFDGTPVFLGCSDVDSHVPKERVEESAAVFTRMGANVDCRIYPGMGHLISDDEIVVAQAILAGISASPA
jgi:predicted esterase